MLAYHTTMHAWKCLGCTVTLLLEDSIQDAICPKCHKKMFVFRWFGIYSLILELPKFKKMSTWNCNKYDMPVTVIQNVTDISCTHCGKKMTPVSEWSKHFSNFLFSFLIQGDIYRHYWCHLCRVCDMDFSWNCRINWKLSLGDKAWKASIIGQWQEWLMKPYARWWKDHRPNTAKTLSDLRDLVPIYQHSKITLCQKEYSFSGKFWLE